MDERMPPAAAYFQYSPSGVHSSPHHSMRPSSDRERYLAELLTERQKLAPFIQVLPFCSRLLNQGMRTFLGVLVIWIEGKYMCAEIVRVSGLAPNQNFGSPDRSEHGTRLRLAGRTLSGSSMDLEGWAGMQAEENGYFQRIGMSPAPPVGWNGNPGLAMSPIVKKVVRLDVPVDKYPNYNFVGRLLGPRGNSLRRVEGTTQCRVYIRGRGSVKDNAKEEMLREKPGYEHLNEPLHVLVEAEFPADIIDVRLNQAMGIVEKLLQPVDESTDYYKKQQLRELAMLNGTLREDSPHMSPSVSPFNSTGMKRAKTGI